MGDSALPQGTRRPRRRRGEPAAATLGARIKRIRVVERGLSQPAFAALVGVSQATVSRWETDLAEPGPAYLAALVEISREYDTVTHLRYGELRSPLPADPVPVLTLAQIARAADGPPGALSAMACEHLPMSKQARLEVAFVVPDDGMEDVAPRGDLCTVDLADRDLDDGAPCLAVVGGAVLFRVYRTDGGVLRFEPRTRSAGYSAVFPKGQHMILGRVLRRVGNLPRSLA